MKSKTLTASTSPLVQKDVDAIETAFTKYTKALSNDDIIGQLLTHDQIGSYMNTDFPAFQFVVAKHGYVANKEPNGVRITAGTNPDPVWLDAGLGNEG